MKKLLLTTTIIFASACCLSAQEMEKLPIDAQVRYGKLDNGLTYYICHNEQPKQRCDFHIAQAVGAILEEDNQNGLAHFLEHMAFNGTEHFPGKGIINYFESLGVNFGGNINAYTSLDKTVYYLSDVPTYREGIIDSALLVMRDWSCGISLLPEEIDAERGVIREEWRTRRNADSRIRTELIAKMYPGSQYAKRDIIGDTAVINNFDYQTLRDYYHKWYGPDNQAIIVVGDIDVDAIEAKIKALWADVPERSNRGERPLYTIEHPTAPRVAIVTDVEAQGSRIQLQYTADQLPEKIQGTAQEYMADLVRGLICDMMDNRMNELAQDPDASFMGGGTYYGECVKLRDAFNAIYVPKEGRETEAFNDLLYQLEKMRRYGFTNAELDRVKSEKLTSSEKYYNERNNRKNIDIAHKCINNYEDGELMPSVEWEYQFVQNMLPVINQEQVNKVAASFIHDNPIVSISGPEKDGVNIPSEETILAALKGMKDLAIEAPQEEVIDTELVKKAPHKGKIKSIVKNDELGTTEWTLNNGIKVVFKPTEFKADEILFKAFSKGGYSLVATEDLPSAQLTVPAIMYMGLGRFSMNQLEKALVGKHVGVGPVIDENREGISGTSSVKDFETMLQLTYLFFTAPRRDKKGFKTLMGLMKNQLLNRDKDPKNVFSDSIDVMVTNHSERTILMNMDNYKRVSLDKVMKVYTDRFANPADFTFTFVGNIDPEDPQTQALICRWLGGMKTQMTREEIVNHNVTVALGKQKNYFTREMETTTASNRIQYTSYDMPYTMDNNLNMQIIGRILYTRYDESIREREGGSYGVSCGGYMNIWPQPRATLLMQFDTDPKKQGRLMEIIHEEVQTIVKDGPLASDLQKEKESMLKDYAEDLETNDYWQDVLLRYYLYGLNYIHDYKPAVEAITAETVQSTLKKLVDAGNVFEVVMSPKEKEQ